MGSERKGERDDSGQGMSLSFTLVTIGSPQRIGGGSTMFLQVHFGCHVKDRLREGLGAGRDRREAPCSRLW